jgi:hypothetical protein
MGDTVVYLCVAATTGTLITRDGRPCFATAEQWGEFKGGALVGPVPQLIPVKTPIFGMLPFDDKGTEPDPVKLVMDAIGKLTRAELRELVKR